MKESIETALEANSIYRNYQGGYFKTLISPEESSGEMAVIEMVLPEGAEPPLHLHENEDETFYVLEGEMAFNIDGEQRTAKPGDAVFAPRKVPHTFKIMSKQATFITVITPGALWNYFIEFSTPATGELQVFPPMGPPPLELVAQLTSRLSEAYGVTFL
ncbi:cupin domain-containing protein [Desertivirga xinjiangensis]|uniref:cupin domain-containing protein n=1 Tax=Desertivirga xinjiangensis TaxID=539206 RepID=UPI00210BD409|nr:cupin domain-containing protein [Pedobacter xinjiangensis]